MLPRNPAHLEGIDDLVKLQFLDEPNILFNLSLRYSQNKIYTNTGPILIAINPWRHLDIYSDGAMDLYKGRDLGELPPHVYGVADSAYRAMLRESRNQVQTRTSKHCASFSFASSFLSGVIMIQCTWLCSEKSGMHKPLVLHLYMPRFCEVLIVFTAWLILCCCMDYFHGLADVTLSQEVCVRLG